VLRELNYVVFDLETTGLYPEDGDEIIEIGAIAVENCQITEQVFHTLVNPGRPIPPSSTAVHGIRDQDVAGAPTIDSAIRNFMSFVGNRIWIAQNARFDLSFIIRKLTQLQIPPKQTVVIDTIGISKLLFPYEQSHALDRIMARLGIPRTGERHRSIDDSRYTALVFLEFLKLLEQQAMTELLHIESAFIRAETLIRVEKPKPRGLFT